MELFTVDYALNYEGWTYDTEVAPYNVYTLDQFTIRVRRNDFFLLLYITNACDELVFAGRIYTIEEYTTKIKKNLTKWKCRVHSTAQPTPSNNLDIVPRVVNLTKYTVGETVNTTVANVFNESATQLNTCSISGFSIRVGTDGFGNEVITFSAEPVTAEVGEYVDTIAFIGEESGTVIQVVFNITVLPEAGNFILLEAGGHIELEHGGNKIIMEH